MMDFETFDFELLGNDAMSWKIHRVEDHTPVLKQNWQDKQFGNNGWKPGRKQRQVARIPFQVIEIAESMGYDMASSEGVYKFLFDYPQYKMVPHIKSPGNGSAGSQGRIIIH